MAGSVGVGEVLEICAGRRVAVCAGVAGWECLGPQEGEGLRRDVDTQAILGLLSGCD